MEIWRAAGIAGLASISLAMQRDVRAQSQPPLPTKIVASVAEEFRRDGSEDSVTVTPTVRSAPAKWRVLLTDPVAAVMTRHGLDIAWRLLGRPACAAVLGEFHDRAGRPLVERVRALGVDVPDYLGLILFIDGTRDAPCTEGTIGFTVVGTRVVRLCSTELKEEPVNYIAGALIHEMLHTLGLGENPPSTREITRRVLERCNLWSR